MAHSRVDLVTFGIIVDDIVFPDGQTRMGVLGGGGPQTAWGMAAALGTGTSVGLVAGIGADLPAGTLDVMRAAGIDLDGVRLTEHDTPRAWQVLEADGRRTQVWRVPVRILGVQLARNWAVLPADYGAARSFHWGIHPSEPGSLPFARELRARGKRVSLEPFRPPVAPLDDDALQAVLGACDVFSPNWLEAQRITGGEDYPAVIARFRGLGGRVLAMRRGPEGADVWDLPAGRGVHVPAVNAEVIDAVGAGNAFCGAFLARLDEGLDVAAVHASVAASYLLEQVGMPAALPDSGDYERRLAEVRAGLRALTLD
jgi:sugar/nucleoside kinase (ribokinase family)